MDTKQRLSDRKALLTAACRTKAHVCFKMQLKAYLGTAAGHGNRKSSKLKPCRDGRCRQPEDGLSQAQDFRRSWLVVPAKLEIFSETGKKRCNAKIE